MVGFSRWAFNIEKWSRNKIEKHIRSECFRNNLNIVLLREQIHKAVLGCRYDFLERDSVSISKQEIEKIKKLPNREYQKAVFGILVFSKKNGLFLGNKLYYNSDIMDVCRKMGIRFSEKEFKNFETFIDRDTKIIEAVMRKSKQSWKISLYEEGDIFVEIRDFSNIVKYLPLWCSVCSKETKSKKSYCPECSKEIRRKKEKDRLRKIYENSRI